MLKQIISDQSIGTKSALAEKLGISPQAVSLWGDTVPVERVLDVCAATNWKVRPHDIRPDIYPNASDGLPPERQAA